MEHMMKEGRSLAETPTYSVASVVTVLVFVCFLVERAIYRFGKVSGPGDEDEMLILCPFVFPVVKEDKKKGTFYFSGEDERRVDVAGAYITAPVTKREMDFGNLCKLFSFQQ
ncbi:hypothetical protein IGI04_038782 [Brassica rapa subsp. trilocularis]|uniref:Uncharacterized protein n=1 Tax=Brassica rapa subsp. trilocularis TaxID=1813537 RepID=A0ABQ7LM23_BRACM|nr:hypothetical protein IGI04_038782 [Brassica rapa subsp. trilocularis]